MAETMLKRASRADLNVWIDTGAQLSREAQKALKTAATGRVFRQLQDEQVRLIKSLPERAGQKVHEWAIETLRSGGRFEDFVERIQTLKPLTESHARLIARTETARARTNFTEARAKAVGSDSYIWHTVGDHSVRDTHAALDGTVQRWDSPPISDYTSSGEAIRSNPACIWNCRCWAEPLFPESVYEKAKL